MIGAVASLAIAGTVPPSCSLDLSKIQVVTAESVKQVLRCNLQHPVRVRIVGNKVYVEAP